MSIRFTVAGLSIVAGAALIAGCAFTQVQPAVSTVQNENSPATQPGAPLTSGSLIYISLFGNGGVGVFSDDGKFVGKLKGFRGNALGSCADPAGNVFVTIPEEDQVREYKHGDSHAIKKLTDENGPLACAVDPLTGDLAVVGGPSVFSGSPPNVRIFKHAAGSGTPYSLPRQTEPFSCTYDDKGNLFVGGYFRGGNTAGHIYLAELPSGAGDFSRVYVRLALKVISGIQWDGKYLAISDAEHTIYRTANGKVVGKTKVEGGFLGSFWIHDGELVAIQGYPQRANLWSYPRGGKVTESFTLRFQPNAVTISAASR